LPAVAFSVNRTLRAADVGEENLVTLADVQVAANTPRSPLAPASATSLAATVTPAQ